MKPLWSLRNHTSFLVQTSDSPFSGAIWYQFSDCVLDTAAHAFAGNGQDHRIEPLVFGLQLPLAKCVTSRGIKGRWPAARRPTSPREGAFAAVQVNQRLAVFCTIKRIPNMFLRPPEVGHRAARYCMGNGSLRPGPDVIDESIVMPIGIVRLESCSPVEASRL